MKVMITGGSGLLGLNWALHARSRHDVAIVSHTRSVRMDGAVSLQWSLETPDSVRELCRNIGPQLIIHTVGYTNVDACQKDPDKAMHTNCKLAGQVAQVAKEVDAKLVHISTDHLFDGSQSSVDETEPPSPINVYGHTKLSGEKLVRSVNPEALVVRTNFYGWGHRYRQSFTDWVLDSIAARRKIDVFHDVYFTPILVDDLIESIEKLIELGVSGVVNVVSDERISKYDFARAIADEFHVSKDYIGRSSLSEGTFVAQRPADMSLSNRKATKLLGRSLGRASRGLLRLKETAGRQNELNAILID